MLISPPVTTRPKSFVTLLPIKAIQIFLLITNQRRKAITKTVFFIKTNEKPDAKRQEIDRIQWTIVQKTENLIFSVKNQLFVLESQ